MNEELFVRKDIFDERTDAIRAETQANNARLEALMEKTIAEHKAITAELKGEVIRLEDKFYSSYEAMNKRIEDGFSRLNITFVAVQIVIALAIWLVSK